MKIRIINTSIITTLLRAKREQRRNYQDETTHKLRLNVLIMCTRLKKNETDKHQLTKLK
jgi:hypothetical protein